MYGVGFDAGSQVPGGRGVGLDTLCDVVDNLGSEAGRAGLSPAAAETRPDQDHPPAEAAGGQGDTDTRECPPPESLDPQRLDAARQLKKGNPLWSSSSLTGWKPAKTKPSKLELWQVIMERDPTKRPKGWNVDKMMNNLLGWTGPVPEPQPHVPEAPNGGAPGGPPPPHETDAAPEGAPPTSVEL